MPPFASLTREHARTVIEFRLEAGQSLAQIRACTARELRETRKALGVALFVTLFGIGMCGFMSVSCVIDLARGTATWPWVTLAAAAMNSWVVAKTLVDWPRHVLFAWRVLRVERWALSFIDTRMKGVSDHERDHEAAG